MSLDPVLAYTRQIVAEAVQAGDVVVDATMGNGIDTAFLAGLVGSTGTVLAYDIQEEALHRTRQRLNAQYESQGTAESASVHLYHKGHETMEDELHHLPLPVSAAMFNLGYLPKGDKKIVTRPETTIRALHGLQPFLKPGGVITIVVYSGHAQGVAEKENILEEVQQWDQRLYHVLHYNFINQRNNPPFLIAIEKRGS